MSDSAAPLPPPSLRARIGEAARVIVGVPTIRTDATTTTVSGVSISNSLSGIGGYRDSGATARPNVERDFLTDEELVALLRGTIYRRIINILPQWGTRRGWTIQDDSDDDKPLDKAMRRIGLTKAIRNADKWGRALGESRILLIVDDGMDAEKPLDPTKVKRLKALQVLDRREFTPITYDTDAESPQFGMPSMYSVHPVRPTATQTRRVHASRLLRFWGDDLPPSYQGMGTAGHTWGADAVGQTLWDGVRNLSQTNASGAKLAQELSIAVFQLAKVSQQGSGDQRTAFLARLATLNMMKSVANAVFLGTDDKFDRVAANPSGFKDLSEAAKDHLGLLTGYPSVLLFGSTPSGLNTDGQSWKDMWSPTVADHQEERYRDPIETIIRCLYAEAGGEPDDWVLEFRPLFDLSEVDAATVREAHTRADAQAIMDGVLSVERVRRSRYGGGTFQTQIQPPTPEEEAIESAEPSEGDIEEVRRLMAGSDPAGEE